MKKAELTVEYVSVQIYLDYGLVIITLKRFQKNFASCPPSTFWISSTTKFWIFHDRSNGESCCELYVTATSFPIPSTNMSPRLIPRPSQGIKSTNWVQLKKLLLLLQYKRIIKGFANSKTGQKI